MEQEWFMVPSFMAFVVFFFSLFLFCPPFFLLALAIFELFRAFKTYCKSTSSIITANTLRWFEKQAMKICLKYHC